MDSTNLLPVGTMIAGYADPKLGPFHCKGCVHRDETPVFHCDHPAVKADFAVPKDSEGRSLVAPGGCCTYFRKG